MPGMDHHTLIIPRAEDEASVLYEIEGRFDANEDWARPPDPRRRSAGLRRQALEHLQGLERLPILFANHPSRSARAIGLYGLDEPWGAPREQRPRAGRVPRHGGRPRPPGRHPHRPERQPVPRLLLEPRGADAGRLRPDDGHRRRPLGRPPRRGAPVLDRGLVRLAFPLPGTGESGERLLARRVPQDLGPGPSDLRRRPRWAPAGPHVRGRRGPRDRARGRREERRGARGGARRHVAGPARGAGHRHRPVPRPGGPERGGGETPPSGGSTSSSARCGGLPPIPRTTATPRRGSSPGSRATRWPATETATPSRRRCPRSTATSYVRVRGTSTDDLEPAMDGPEENPWRDLWFYSNPIFIEVE